MPKPFPLPNRVVEIVRTARASRRGVDWGTFAPIESVKTIGIVETTEMVETIGTIKSIERVARSAATLIVFLVATLLFVASANGGDNPAATEPKGAPSASSPSTSTGPETPLSPEILELLRRDANGTQTRYPAVAKIVGRGKLETKENGEKAIPLYYGSGSLVAVYDDLGLVLTNWHVVSESDASIEAVFPNFSSEALVALRDEAWDLAALVVRRPPGVAPIPVSLQVPRPGETLWIAGYGQKAGLDNFQIRSGRLISYVDLVSPNATPTETLAIDAGARQGDSGGPIFNRYGEIAGVLWGSDGKATMGTYCLRVQIFLTQAVARVAALRAKNWDEARSFETTNDLARWNREGLLGKGAVASTSEEAGDVRETSVEAVETVVSAEPGGVPESKADRGKTKEARGRRALRKAIETGVAVEEDDRISAIDALPSYGVFPISTEPAYSAPNGGPTAESLLKTTSERAREAVERAANALERDGKTVLPPSPPIFSPTFVVQQRQTGRACPETADASFWAKLDESAVRLKRGKDSLARGVDGATKTVVRTSETSEENPVDGNEPNDEPDSGRAGGGSANVGETVPNAPVGSERAASFETASWSKGDDDGSTGDSTVKGGALERLESAANAASKSISNAAENAAGELSKNAESARDALAKAGEKIRPETKENGESSNRGSSADGLRSLSGAATSDAGDDAKGGDDILRVWQKYVLVCAVFALFYNSARLLGAAEFRAERRRAAKRRRKGRFLADRY